MAERRMFAKTIIDSDAFLDMPLSTQALYFHLSMRADDEGFINNPKKVQRMIGASDDDMKVLIAKNFIIPFDSGVVVIKHWRIHNYIRADRLMETKYTEERSHLSIKENGAYTVCEVIGELEEPDATDKRKIAYQNSSLPYSFSYKMKRAFEGRKCPICGRTMTSSSKSAMPTIQHNVPISKGGVHELDNISIICESCNTSLRDTETGQLNNSDVVLIWDKVVYADNNKIQWFNNLSLLDEIDVSQMSGTCQPNGSIGKDRLGKDRLELGKDRLGNTPPLSPPPGETGDNLEELFGYNEFLLEAVRDWLTYKKEKRQNYKGTGLKSFLTQIKNRVAEYGEDAVISVIQESMAQNYQGITWDKLKQQNKQSSKSGYSAFDILRREQENDQNRNS